LLLPHTFTSQTKKCVGAHLPALGDRRFVVLAFEEGVGARVPRARLLEGVAQLQHVEVMKCTFA